MSAAGVRIPARIVAPGLPAAVSAPETTPEERLDVAVPAPPLEHASRRAPRSGTDRPIIVPRRRNSRRGRWPAANSSMTCSAIAPLPFRRTSRRRWLMVVRLGSVSMALPPLASFGFRRPFRLILTQPADVCNTRCAYGNTFPGQAFPRVLMEQLCLRLSATAGQYRVMADD